MMVLPPSKWPRAPHYFAPLSLRLALSLSISTDVRCAAWLRLNATLRDNPHAIASPRRLSSACPAPVPSVNTPTEFCTATFHRPTTGTTGTNRRPSQAPAPAPAQSLQPRAHSPQLTAYLQATAHSPQPRQRPHILHPPASRLLHAARCSRTSPAGTASPHAHAMHLARPDGAPRYIYSDFISIVSTMPSLEPWTLGGVWGWTERAARTKQRSAKGNRFWYERGRKR